MAETKDKLVKAESLKSAYTKAKAYTDIKTMVLNGGLQIHYREVASGGTVDIEVPATSGATYQWQYKTPTGTNWYDSNMTGATTNKLTVNGSNSANIGRCYRCKITKDGKSYYSTITKTELKESLVQTDEGAYVTISNATTTKDGLMSKEDKAKLDNVRRRRVVDIVCEKGRLLKVAHQGMTKLAPRGSYPAFELACKNGADVLNIAQCRHSADNTWYCAHEEGLSGWFGVNGVACSGNISDKTDEYLATVSHRNGSNVDNYTATQLHIVKVEEILKLAHQYGVMVMLRLGSFPNTDTDADKDVIESFIALCEKYDGAHYIYSGTIGQLTVLHKYRPNWHKQNYSVAYTTSAGHKNRVNDIVENGWTDASIMVDSNMISKELSDYAHSKDMLMMSAKLPETTSDFDEAYKNMSDAGVDMINIEFDTGVITRPEKSWIDSIIEAKLRELGVINQSLSGYVTTSALNEALIQKANTNHNHDGVYLKEHQSLSDYATKTYVDEKLGGISEALDELIRLAGGTV